MRGLKVKIPRKDLSLHQSLLIRTATRSLAEIQSTDFASKSIFMCLHLTSNLHKKMKDLEIKIPKRDIFLHQSSLVQTALETSTHLKDVDLAMKYTLVSLHFR